MAKKLISVWLSLTILLFSSISIYAEENVQGDFFIKDININGEEINNNQLQYPFFLFENTTYVPITTEIGKILGIEAKMDFESRTLKLLKTEPTLKNISERFKKNEREDVLTQIFNETKVLVYEQVESQESQEIRDSQETQDLSEPNVDNIIDVYKEAEAVQTTSNDANSVLIEMPELSVKEIDLEGFAVLTTGNVVYLPLRVMTEVFKWDVYFDPNTGVYVSTTEGVPAQS